ncbi:DNA polymerase domain-containing protein [Pseudonocardia oroxyli]|uniref:DNA ligase D, polymerase domain-containing protein n=1 Tax=Pseudonocardia oroxyli TaxID=366584 RepID=A0A1G7DUJ2_PSEOR|nr:ATP-dependent DNA ligase [Pseudonocardia oroxyli]SDE55141.1 DNA ligase D, polymerase domain-containing protein [Pseudonocardia oroxyli]
MSGTHERAGVALSSLDSPVLDGDPATKGDLVDYLDAVADRMLPVLARRPLTVTRVRPGQEPFVQKNLPKYTPDWVESTTIRSQTGREVRYALCDDRRTLLWFANQRAVEYHPGLFTVDDHAATQLVLDLDPPEGAGFEAVVAVAHLVREALGTLRGAVKTSGSKGVHIVVPLVPTGWEDAAAATRALAARAAALDPTIATTAFVKEEREGKVFVDSTRSGGATVVAAYSPRVRPGLPVSFPLEWSELDSASPGDFTIATAPALLADRPTWTALLPEPQTLPADVVAEGHEIPVARVQAMHEGKRRKREARRQR